MTSNATRYDMPLMHADAEKTVLFHPHIGRRAQEYVNQVLESRWIGQGPRVDEFEEKFMQRIAPNSYGVAVGSGTDALHLAYMLAGISHGDEVVVPVFTCTATNLPLLYLGAKLKFVDVDPTTLNIDVRDLETKVSSKTKAIVVVHYAGYPVDLSEVARIAAKFGIPVIEDAAQALGATFQGKNVGEISDFTVFSFQAIKHISTGDGGFLTFQDGDLLEKAKRLRWFGIDRSAKQKGIWENDIREIGYKYQMTDVGAAMGIAGLEELDEILAHRREILSVYEAGISDCERIRKLWSSDESRTHAAWLATVSVEDRMTFQEKLWKFGIETNQVHYRNDRYSVFGSRQQDLRNMDAIEDRYVCLPIHTRMTPDDARRVCEVIGEGW